MPDWVVISSRRGFIPAGPAAGVQATLSRLARRVSVWLPLARREEIATCRTSPVPPHVVREIAGHSDVKVTMTVYAHGHLSEKAAALAQLGAAVAGALPSAVAVNPGAGDPLATGAEP